MRIVTDMTYILHAPVEVHVIKVTTPDGQLLVLTWAKVKNMDRIPRIREKVPTTL